MICYGRNIKKAGDELSKVAIEQIAARIKKPKPDMRSFIDQLRTVASIDHSMYRKLKIQLPYFVAAIFNPLVRKKENFAFAEYFILDIDHLTDKDISIDNLMKKFANDKRIVLAFRSPSNDGIKVFFKFSNKVFDSGKYSLFYRAFVYKFAQEYSIQQYVDKRTSDVSRACFYSYDENAIYNPNAITINMNAIVNFENELEIKEIQYQIKEYEKKQVKPNDSNSLRQELPKDILESIREKLNPKIIVKRERNIFVPEELDEVLADINMAMSKHDIEVKNIRNINYGKQFRFGVKHLWTEINLFYGKKGYSIVISNKSGSDKKMGDIVFQIINQVLYGQEEK